ncbi:MAG: TM2 domain-containing protein [Bacillales bacterium]|nr:TM2 domain-containing protein [Bacillales bacterium]MDY6003188.1 TM2 domain-containing protein [Bacilli bacterium]
MPKCKYCGAQISKFDKDICPMCGEKKPLDGVLDETVDFTHVLDAVSDTKEEVNFKSRIVAGILAILFGFLGAHNFYVGKYRLAVINLIESVVGIGGIGSILFFLTPLKIWGYLIPYFIILAINIWIGVTYFVRHDLKDGHGGIMR